MKVIIIAFALLTSFMANANCVEGALDKTVSYCSGTQVYLDEGSQVVGPLLLKAVADVNNAVVQINGTNNTYDAAPWTMIAIESGCTVSGKICVGNVVTNMNDGQDYKVVGRFERNSVAAALCLNEACSEFANFKANVTIIKHMSEKDLQPR